MKLDESRKQIDEIDAKILALLNLRANTARQIGRIKASAGLPIVDLEREEVVLRRVIRENDGEISDRALTRIYRVILSESRRVQNRVAVELAANGELTK